MTELLPSLSLVVELENIKTVPAVVLGVVLDNLAAQLRPELGRMSVPPELIFAYEGEASDADAVIHRIRQEAPALAQLPIQAVGLKDGRYYEIKNEGAKHATGDIIIFLDSDTVPEGDWLNQLVAPFADPSVLVASGHTFLDTTDFQSRTLALIWFFPLERDDKREASRRSINANNFAARRQWFSDIGRFPPSKGFKVSCSLLYRRLRDAGGDCVRVQAHCRHEALRGWRFLAWRAAVTGRDGDRKFALMTSEDRGARLRHAFSRWGTMTWRTARRIVTKRRVVGLPAWQVPAAIALGWSFYTIAFVNEAMAASGLLEDQIEQVPAFVEHH